MIIAYTCWGSLEPIFGKVIGVQGDGHMLVANEAGKIELVHPTCPGLKACHTVEDLNRFSILKEHWKR